MAVLPQKSLRFARVPLCESGAVISCIFGASENFPTTKVGLSALRTRTSFYGAASTAQRQFARGLGLRKDTLSPRRRARREPNWGTTRSQGETFRTPFGALLSIRLWLAPR